MPKRGSSLRILLYLFLFVVILTLVYYLVAMGVTALVIALLKGCPTC